MTEFPLDPQLCARCGGRCCQETPGVWVDPQRFLAVFDLSVPQVPGDLDAALAARNLTWRDLGGVLVPLPQSDDKHGCLLQGVDGCSLPPQQRPCQCLALEPSPETLRQDELCCELPDAFRLIEARRAWGRFWEAQVAG